jgi:hypothetical protein
MYPIHLLSWGDVDIYIFDRGPIVSKTPLFFVGIPGAPLLFEFEVVDVHTHSGLRHKADCANGLANPGSESARYLLPPCKAHEIECGQIVQGWRSLVTGLKADM